MKSKCIGQLHPHIFHIHQLHQILLHSSQLTVPLTIVVRQNWHCILKLIRIRISCIVNQNYILQLSIHHPQIFYIYPLVSWPAILPKQPMMHQLFLLVEEVDYCICILRMAGCEDYNLEVFAEISQYFSSIRSYIDSCLYMITVYCFDEQLYITVIGT